MAQNSVFQQYPQPFAGFQYQYSNIQINLQGRYFPWVSSVSYSDTNDVAEARGVSPYPMGTTLGEYKASGSLEIHKLYNKDFLDILASLSPDGKSIYDVIFSINVQYQLRPANGQVAAPVVTDVLQGCRITGQGQDMSAGNAVLTVKHSLYIALIQWSGYLPIAGLAQ